MNGNSDEEGHDDEADLYRQTMECHGDSWSTIRAAAQSFNGYVTMPRIRRKQRLHAQRAVGERVQAGDAASEPRAAREGR